MKVLYVNHTGAVSGAERSLLTLIDAVRGEVEVHVAAPAGPLDDELSARGLETARISGTAGSLRLHPVHTPRAVYELVRSGAQVRRLVRRRGIDVVHANSIRGGVACSLVPSAPLATHVRDCLPPGRASAATLRLIASRSAVVIANSRYTAHTVSAVAPRAPLEVLYNPVDTRRFDPDRFDRGQQRRSLDADADAPLLIGVVAQITPWKGQRTMVEAMSLLRARGVPARLLLAGSAKFTASATRYDNLAYEGELRQLADRLGVADSVRFLGEVRDVPALMAALDLLALPSREEPFGRAVVEAMAMGVPVLATAVGGPAEIVEDGVEGLLLDPADPAAWAQSAATLAADPALRGAMGAAGRRKALQRFTAEGHAAAAMAIYRRITA